MEKNTNVPRLRFPEFEGEWELKKLGEIAEVNPKTGSLPNSFIYIDLESVVDGQLLKEERIELVNAPSRAQRLLSEGDILFQMVRPYQKNNLYFNYNGEYVASTGYAQIRTNNNPKYIYQYLHFQEFTDRVIERCTGTSYPAINSTDLSNIRIAIPVLPEQIKIASFLTAADNKLTQLKKKKSLLDEYKKGVMQKIFSQELRFKDDNGEDFPEWEEKRLGEIFVIKAGGDIDKSNVSPLKTEKYKYPIYSNSEKNKGLFGFSDVYKISKECITVTGRGSLGIAYARYEKFYPIVRLLILLPQLPVEVKFYENAINRINFAIESTGVPQLTGPQISNYVTIYPSLPEQTKIANFLSAIDERINHCSKQIERMEDWKKGLLQQMFV